MTFTTLRSERWSSRPFGGGTEIIERYLEENKKILIFGLAKGYMDNDNIFCIPATANAKSEDLLNKSRGYRVNLLVFSNHIPLASSWITHKQMGIDAVYYKDIFGPTDDFKDDFLEYIILDRNITDEYSMLADIKSYHHSDEIVKEVDDLRKYFLQYNACKLSQLPEEQQVAFKLRFC